MLNTQQFAPTIGNALAYDADIRPTLRGVDVTAPGTLVVLDIYDRQAIYEFAIPADGVTAGAHLPYRLELQIKRIVGDGAGAVGNGTTGTDIALANLIPLT